MQHRQMIQIQVKIFCAGQSMDSLGEDDLLSAMGGLDEDMQMRHMIGKRKGFDSMRYFEQDFLLIFSNQA